MAKKKREANDKRVMGFLGIGFDNEDGHKRLTRTDHFYLVGGSAETHGRMQDTAVRFAEELSRRGKPLDEAPVEEIIEIFHQSRS